MIGGHPDAPRPGSATDRLLLVDLDGTLIDRNRAFRAAAADFLVSCGMPPTVLDWFISRDADGFTPRAELAGALLAGHPQLREHEERLRALLDAGGSDLVTLEPGVRSGLEDLRDDGWRIVVVTNGPAGQQGDKIIDSGLDALIDAQVISEAVGLRKPDAAIFRMAADLVGLPLSGAWMVGDSPTADIAGAAAAGCRSVWVSHGRTWPDPVLTPGRIASDTPAALAYLRGQR